ncbi:MAG: thioredoxin [Phycisphaerales bacterium]|nr:thioredoxin [Phycisphaerales bacterium]
MAGANTLTFNQDNFEAEVLQSNVPVLVDFWATWCGPCHMLAPVIDDLATSFQGKAKIGKVDVDTAQELAAQYGISNIPTVLVFHKGEQVARIIGAKHKKEYEETLKAHLAG